MGYFMMHNTSGWMAMRKPQHLPWTACEILSASTSASLLSHVDYSFLLTDVHMQLAVPRRTSDSLIAASASALTVSDFVKTIKNGKRSADAIPDTKKHYLIVCFS